MLINTFLIQMLMEIGTRKKEKKMERIKAILLYYFLV
jgi:hypothetical protein